MHFSFHEWIFQDFLHSLDQIKYQIELVQKFSHLQHHEWNTQV